MSYKILFVLNALVVFALGLALVVTPEITLNLFGTETRVAELSMARFLGTALVTVGLLLWFAKDTSDSQVQKSLGMGMLAATVLALVVTILGVALDGIIRNFGWLVIIVEVLFGLGYGFMIFLQPKMK